MNANLAKATVVGALGGLLFGFDTAVISGTTHALTLLYGLTDWTLGVTVTMALAGTIIGAMSSGIPGQRWGGRETLRVLAVFYVLSALGCAFAWNWPSLLIARLIGGLGIGGSSVLGPVYIAELAPAKLRGRLVGLFQINVSLRVWGWAQRSGAGSSASPRFPQSSFLCCSSASLAARAGWSPKIASKKHAQYFR